MDHQSRGGRVLRRRGGWVGGGRGGCASGSAVEVLTGRHGIGGKAKADATAECLLGLSAALSASFFFSSRRRHTILTCDWSSDVCSSDLQASRRACSGPAAAC